MPLETKSEEGRVRNGWEDDFMRGADYTINFINLIMSERSQLYGTLIHMFVEGGIDEIVLPSRGILNAYGHDYYLLFHKEGDEFKLTLRRQENNEA